MILYNPAIHEEVTCSNCGKTCERRWVEEFNTGRSKLQEHLMLKMTEDEAGQGGKL